MKLIDLLVRELPKRGGWPEGAVECVRFVDEATIDFYDEHGNWPDDCSLIYGPIAKSICITPAYPCQRESVTLVGYEAALAASKPDWDGEGLPPVGCECEIVDKDGLLRYGHGESGEVIAHVENTAVIRMSYGLGCFNAGFLRPIRSEADKKRAKGVIALSRVDPLVVPFEYGEKTSDGSLVAPFWYELYDAIAAGNVDGIKLED